MASRMRSKTISSSRPVMERAVWKTAPKCVSFMSSPAALGVWCSIIQRVSGATVPARPGVAAEPLWSAGVNTGWARVYEHEVEVASVGLWLVDLEAVEYICNGEPLRFLECEAPA